jgi:hypothetical protein
MTRAHRNPGSIRSNANAHADFPGAGRRRRKHRSRNRHSQYVFHPSLLSSMTCRSENGMNQRLFPEHDANKLCRGQGTIPAGNIGGTYRGSVAKP